MNQDSENSKFGETSENEDRNPNDHVDFENNMSIVSALKRILSLNQKIVSMTKNLLKKTGLLSNKFQIPSFLTCLAF